MQYTKDKLISQQLAMFHLGFYTGNIDGIWGPDSQEAKRKFERCETFLPAYPNGGMPFGERDRLPTGWKYVEGNLITVEGLTNDRAKEIISAVASRNKPEVKQTPVAVPVEAEPAIERPVETTAEANVPTLAEATDVDLKETPPVKERHDENNPRQPSSGKERNHRR